MKEQKYNWEADVRQKVVEYEFEYDAMEWGNMTQLLDDAGSPPPASKPGHSSDFGFWGSWKMGLFIFILAGAFLSWFLMKPNLSGTSEIAEPPVNTISQPIKKQESEPYRSAPQQKKTLETSKTILQKNAERLPGASDRGNKSSIEKTDVNEHPNEVNPEPEKDTAVKREMVSSVKLLPRFKEIPLLTIPNKNPDFLKLKLPKPPKRKRDRKKLYPDVIENY